MAQRQDFTFPYTGRQIAEAIEARLAKLTAQRDALDALDNDVLAALDPDDGSGHTVRSRRRALTRLDGKIEQLSRELRAYQQAALTDQQFDLDLDDVAYFEL